MTTEDILLFIVSFCVGWWLRGVVVAFLIQREINAGIRVLHRKVVKSNKVISTPVTTLTQIYYEQVDGNYYLYNVHGNVFICQGSTLQEAAQNYSKHNTDIACYSDPHNTDNSFFIVDGQIHHTIDSSLLGQGGTQ